MIEIYRMVERDGEPADEVIGAIRIGEDGDIVFDGLPDADAAWLMDFECFEGGRSYEIEDGEEWLRRLPANLRGYLIWAEEADATAVEG
jgi:hypothetical protein